MRDPQTLPPFPVDDETLDLLALAITPSGGRSSLSELLDLLAGIDRTDRSHLAEEEAGVFDDDRPHYHPNDAIAALVAEVRRLRETPCSK